MIMNAMFIDVFCFSYEIKAEDNNEHTLSFFFFPLPLQKTMTSLPTRLHLLVFFPHL